MADDNKQSGEELQDPCEIECPDPRCPVLSWVLPSVAVLLLYIGLRYSTVAVFNLLVVAFGFFALVRSLVHLRKFGSSGMGLHIVAGVVLNVVIIVLIFFYLFVGSDPLHIRP